MSPSREKTLAGAFAALALAAGLLAAGVAGAQPGGPPPPPPSHCPPGYHWDGPQGCRPDGPGIRPLCPPNMAWRDGSCHLMTPPGRPGTPPPPPGGPGAPPPPPGGPGAPPPPPGGPGTPPPPPSHCPSGYHWDGPRGCWPDGPGIRPLCPPDMAWRDGSCHRQSRPDGPPPPRF